MWELIKKLKHPVLDFHLSRVESHSSSPGFPDMDYCVQGVGNQIELKSLDSSKCEIRDTQVMWFRERVKVGGNPLVLVHSNGKWILLMGRSVPAIFDILKGDKQKREERLISIAWKTWEELSLELILYMYLAPTHPLRQSPT